MSERYQRLFELDKNLYVTGSPVVISAGALTKDNETGRVFIQLKIRNISDKTIKAVIASFSGYDVQKNYIGEKIVYEYLDLNCNFNEEIGAKTPVFLNNAGTRSFSADNIKIIFSDDTSYEVDFSQAVPIPEIKELNANYDEDQICQIKKQFGTNCRNLPQKYSDLFICSCGAINHSEKCFYCGNSIIEMISVDPEVLKKDGIYNKALDEFSKEKKENCKKAIEYFESIIDWKDSNTKIDECNAKIQEIIIAEEKAEAERKRKAEEARIAAEKKKALYKKIAIIGGPIVAALIAFIIVLNTVILPTSNYKKALAEVDAGNYEKAYSMFIKNPNYKDSAKQAGNARGLEIAEFIRNGKYDEAEKLAKEMDVLDAYKDGMYTWAEKAIEAKEFEAAYEIYNRFSDTEKIEANIYSRAMEYLTDDKYVSAYELFIRIPKYLDSSQKVSEIIRIRPEMPFKFADVGDYILFGKYYQSDSKTKEDLEWRVLAKEDNRVLIISKYALEEKKFEDTESPATWETCSLRKWMNNSFYKTAFSKSEQNVILSSKVTADKNPQFKTKPGNNTIDKVFILSISEAEKYFKNDTDRNCYATAYSDAYDDGGCQWWLRTPGRDNTYTSTVFWGGRINTYGDYSGKYYLSEYNRWYENTNAVRPAIWIDIS